ncbi:MAG: GAF domain-containing protein [Anaerolineae bacterium]|nr:MAG: GAF domain-containing protein [Anaerolineae bacterium]
MSRSEPYPPTDPTAVDVQQVLDVMSRANEISSTTESQELLEQMLDLIIEVCGADTGTMYLLDAERHELSFQLVRGQVREASLTGMRIPEDEGIVGAAVQQRRPVVVEDLASDPRWSKIARPQGVVLRNTIAFPLLLRGRPEAAIQVFNFRKKPLHLIQMLGNRMIAEYEKTVLLQTSRAYGSKLERLLKLMTQISATLDKDRLIERILDEAHRLLDAEGVSLFLLDDPGHELILHSSKGEHPIPEPVVRLPVDAGIIGYVVRSGEVVCLRDAAGDPRHYPEIDRLSGVTTRSLLAVPLRMPDVIFGQERGITEGRIIGGLEAINKQAGEFSQDDVLLLSSLAQQTALVIYLSNLYTEADELFVNTVRALVAAIDAKDPYTEGHSQRVSEYSVAMASELDLPPRVVQQVRLGALLHDIGKIGVPDTILRKPDRLTAEEYAEIKKHPLIGAKIIESVHQLEEIVPALAQHHERVDGKGYPLGLEGENISMIARLVAVADTFDALTSERPYRPAMNLEDALDIIRKSAGSQLDARCVDAFFRAYLKGKIKLKSGGLTNE